MIYTINDIIHEASILNNMFRNVIEQKEQYLKLDSTYLQTVEWCSDELASLQDNIRKLNQIHREAPFNQVEDSPEIEQGHDTSPLWD